MTTETWTNSTGDDSLNNPSNWSGGVVPGVSDTAIFGAGNYLVRENNSGSFSPGTVTLQNNSVVSFDDPTLYHFTTLEIGLGATASFASSAIEAKTVDNWGVLDVSQAGQILGNGTSYMFLYGAEWMSSQWSSYEGFGNTPLSAIIQNYTIENTQISKSVTPPDWMQGAISLGNNNDAIYSQVDSMPHSSDASSYYGAPPVTSGRGVVYDTSILRLGPMGAPQPLNDLTGYNPSGIAYTHLFG